MKTALKILALLLAVAVAAAGYFDYLPVPDVNASALTLENPYKKAFPELEGLARNELSEKEKLLYDAVFAAAESCEAQVTVKNTDYTEDSFTRVITAIAFDRPDIFWVDYWNCYYLVDASGSTFSFTYKYSGADLAARRNKLDNAVEKLLLEIDSKGFTTEYDKAVYTHDYLARNCVYDVTLRQNDIHNAYGALVNGKAVCDGYSFAFCLIMQKLGITCTTVLGDGKDENQTAKHAWNNVTLDGVTTNIDVTWDDLDKEHNPDSTLVNAVGHAYFGLSDSEIATNHSMDDVISPKVNKAVSNGWYARHSLQVTNQLDAIDLCAEQLVNNLVDKTSYFELQITVPDMALNFLRYYENGMNGILEKANELQKEKGGALFTSDDSYYFWLNEELGSVMVVFETE